MRELLPRTWWNTRYRKLPYSSLEGVLSLDNQSWLSRPKRSYAGGKLLALCGGTFLMTLAAFSQPVHSFTVSSSTQAGTPIMQYFGLAATRALAETPSKSLIWDSMAISASFLARMMRRLLHEIILTSFLPTNSLTCPWTLAGFSFLVSVLIKTFVRVSFETSETFDDAEDATLLRFAFSPCDNLKPFLHSLINVRSHNFATLEKFRAGDKTDQSPSN